jgi:hypothetical protein
MALEGPADIVTALQASIGTGAGRGQAQQQGQQRMKVPNAA